MSRSAPRFGPPCPGGRVVAVVTPRCVAGDCQRRAGRYQSLPGDTDIFIYPGYPLRSVDAMLTNFHLPPESPRVDAGLSGRKAIMAAYAEAISPAVTAFFSYGDAYVYYARANGTGSNEADRSHVQSIRGDSLRGASIFPGHHRNAPCPPWHGQVLRQDIRDWRRDYLGNVPPGGCARAPISSERHGDPYDFMGWDGRFLPIPVVSRYSAWARCAKFRSRGSGSSRRWMVPVFLDPETSMAIQRSPAPISS